MNSIDSSATKTATVRQSSELHWYDSANSIDSSIAKTSTDRHEGELRRFGLLMFAAFVTLGGLSLWRGKSLGPYLLGIAAFFLAGLVAPRLLAPIEKIWMRLAYVISVVMTYVILCILFFAVITPFGLVMRFCGHDPLRLKKSQGPDSFWKPVDPGGPGGRPTMPF